MKIIKKIVVMLTFYLLASCSEKTLELYSGGSYLQFGPEQKFIYTPSLSLRDTLKSYSFFYEPIKESTLDMYYDLYSLGGSKNIDREFILVQEMVDGVENAVAGVNYVAFNDQTMKLAYIFKAGEVHMKVPIRIIKPNIDDPKLYTLKFKIVSNSHFQLGEEKLLWRKLTFSHNQQQPKFWNNYIETYFFGKYSRTKHSFMIEFSGQKWNDEFYATIEMDENLPSFWRLAFKKEVIRINNESGKEWLDENGEPILFP